MVPKPQIFFQASDPMCRISGKHFNQLMTRYGSPIVILNLVKKRERRRKHESLLSDYLQSSVQYLNTFLHEENFLQYIHFDMARCSKKKNVEVMSKLAEIGKKNIYTFIFDFEQKLKFFNLLKIMKKLYFKPKNIIHLR